jgi:DNA-binding response OmpR family regulator
MLKQTIYIADDEEPIRELISMFLLNEGYSVTAFANGDDLLRAFLDKPADMVILDVMMPGTDGMSLCTKLRERSNVPIVIVSARDSEVDRITGITLGSDDYLTKPFSPLELAVRVRALFRRLELDTGGGAKSVLTAGRLRVDLDTRQVEADGKPFGLTPTEFAFLVYLLRNANRAVSARNC